MGDERWVREGLPATRAHHTRTRMAEPILETLAAEWSSTAIAEQVAWAQRGGGGRVTEGRCTALA